MNNKLKFFNPLISGGNKRLMVISTQASTITRKAKTQKTTQKILLLYLYSRDGTQLCRISTQDDEKHPQIFFGSVCL